MASRPVIVNGLPASLLVSSLPMSGEDKSFCLCLLDRLEMADGALSHEACVELERFIGELMTSALSLNSILVQNCQALVGEDGVCGRCGF